MIYYKILLLDIVFAIVLLIIVVFVIVLIAFPWQIFSSKQITLSSVLNTAKTGDLVLFSSSTPELRFASLNQWSHIGMVVENPNDSQSPYFVESDIPLTERGRFDLFTNELDKNGVKLIYLKDKIEGYKGTMAFRKLNFKNGTSHPKFIQYQKQNTEQIPIY